jgi:putative transposase
MARPLRVNVKDGWYHVTARGTERRTIFDADRDHAHFLELLEEVTSRYAVEIHAYALMGNHYHLLIRTPEANASAAIQWLNVSYSVWFNRKRSRVGHVFQGRFTSVLIDGGGSWAGNASVYVHLNPVRTAAHGLGKSANRAEGLGLVKPDPEELKRRMKTLRSYRWSSFCAYGGYAKRPAWLHTEELLRRAGGRKKYRRYVQKHVTRGIEPEGYEDILGRLALGAREFVEKAKGWVGRVTKEQPARKELLHRVSVDAIVRLVEEKTGREWSELSVQHGYWGRELALYLARKRSGLTLRQIGEALGGLEYKTVSKAIQRFEASLLDDMAKRQLANACLANLSNVEGVLPKS